MVTRSYISLALGLLSWFSFSQVMENETTLTGVYQGRTLFVQNPFIREAKDFCITEVYINKSKVEIPTRRSALKLDFEGYDLFTPVHVQLIHKDSICQPKIINPEAILFHTIFRFSEVTLSDSALLWTTKGENGMGYFELEKLDVVWRVQDTIRAQGVYEQSDYSYFPVLDEGANKYRLKYNFPSGSRIQYIYSWEVDYDHYPEPVEFKPKNAKTTLYLSRASQWEIYNANSEMVLSGSGKEVDIRGLRRGEYVIYFNGKDPGLFYRD